MGSRPLTVTSRLLKPYQAPNPLGYIRHRCMSQSSPTSVNTKLLTIISRIPRTPGWTSREQRERSQRRFQNTSVNDQSPNKEANKNATANTSKHESDTSVAGEDAGKSAANASEKPKRKPKPLPDDHAPALEEVKQRLSAWINPILAAENPPRSNPLTELVEGVYITLVRPKAHTYTMKVSFDRIEKANALNAKLLTNLTLVFQALGTLPGLCVVRLSSAKRIEPGRKLAREVFSAGADVKEMSQIETLAQAEAFIRTVSALCTAIRDLPALVIALIHGPCIGAALELAASCDLRYATTAATFSMPEVLLGIPSVVQARLLCDIVGWARARELMLTGATWSADQALQAGLVSAAFKTAGQMGEHTATLARQIAQMPQAYLSQKRLMRLWEDCSIDEGIEASVKAFTDVWQNDQTKGQTKRAMEEVLAKKRTTKSLETSDDAPPRNVPPPTIRKTFFA